MGDVFWGLHAPIAAALVGAQSLTTAFETGTYFGFGALQLAALVPKVYTVESDPNLYEFCKNTYRTVGRVEFLHGESDAALAKYARNMTEPTLFVLDAHWFPMSPRSEYRPNNLCPVIEELQAISNAPQDILRRSAVIVDDAQMFLGSLKTPFVRSALPSIAEVLRLVGETFDEVTVTDDVIVGSTADGSAAITEYLAWRDRLHFP